MSPTRTLEHPEGSRLPALERNILKYRAFEMMLSLFYAEELKRFLISTVETNRKWNEEEEENPGKRLRAANYAVGADVFFNEGYLSKEERQEIKELIAFRNDIAHELHMLTFDVGRSSFTRRSLRLGKMRYDYEKVHRLKFYRKELPRRIRQRLALSPSFNFIYFAEAERVYESELRLLDRKIRKQMMARKIKLDALNSEMRAGIPKHLHPNFPTNLRPNGTLSARGTEVCYRLLDLGKSPLAIAYLMQVSKRAINAHKKTWLKLGGVRRPTVRLPSIAG